VLSRGIPQDNAWREEGKHIFDLVLQFMAAVQSFAEALDPPGDLEAAEDPRTAFRAVQPAHDKCIAALDQWIMSYAPGARNLGRRDPSRGGFTLLSAAFQDAYKSVVLAHLSILGLAYYDEQLAAEGLTDRVTEALGLAVDWYDVAMGFAQSVIDEAIQSDRGKTVKPLGSVSSYAIFSMYRDRVPDSARKAYDELQPYLNELNAQPVKR
jgi:hypothetical protein